MTGTYVPHSPYHVRDNLGNRAERVCVSGASAPPPSFSPYLHTNRPPLKVLPCCYWIMLKIWHTQKTVQRMNGQCKSWDAPNEAHTHFLDCGGVPFYRSQAWQVVWTNPTACNAEQQQLTSHWWTRHCVPVFLIRKWTPDQWNGMDQQHIACQSTTSQWKLRHSLVVEKPGCVYYYY